MKDPEVTAFWKWAETRRGEKSPTRAEYYGDSKRDVPCRKQSNYEKREYIKQTPWLELPKYKRNEKPLDVHETSFGETAEERSTREQRNRDDARSSNRPPPNDDQNERHAEDSE